MLRFRYMVLAIMCCIASFYASAISIEEYAGKLRKYDIEVSLPNQFQVLDTSVFNLRIFSSPINNADATPAIYYDMAAEGDEKNAMIFFPYIPSYIIKYGHIGDIKKGPYIQSEIRVATDNRNLDVNGRVKFLDSSIMPKVLNADTVAIYHLPLKSPIFNRYNHCYGIYLRKYAHPGMLLKLFLTDEGLKQLDEYLEILLKSISFGNNPSREMIDLDNKYVHIRDCEFDVMPIEIKRDINLPAIVK